MKRAVPGKNQFRLDFWVTRPELLREMITQGIRPDMVTDQTSAHDPLNGYLPIGWTLEEAEEKRKTDPQAVIDAACKSMATHVNAMLEFQRMGIPRIRLR